MDLRHLRSFLAVAQEKNFTRAANRLHMAQPPLSQRIRQLEAELDVQLFDRCTRRVELTHAGKTFYEAVESVLSQLDLAVEACRRADRGETGLLRMGYSGRASHLLLPRLMVAFRTRFPQVVLDLVGPLPTGDLRAGLLDDQLDVVLCFLPLTDPGIACRSFAPTEFVLVLPTSHPLAGQEEVALAELIDDPFVGYPSNKGYRLRDAMDAECARAGFKPRVVRESANSQVLLCLVAAGTGASIVPRELQFQEHIGGIEFKSLGQHAHRLDHGMAWRRDNGNPALINFLSIDVGAD
ncbi:LysR family transcriptional regulator [Variovorax sp. M-6]|uniref:LysR family transcriptional regulator n=1 Tax=Variovorax sp. M-6 TaxID=3233041 RepID=UPI003F982D30